ncbi:MAG TPA: T9SS type A sorting domain-containing protein [Ferruginibacter sp.]|nr:T9SS type A sorting domain-containing protein [Ferruginibacter sp.]
MRLKKTGLVILTLLAFKTHAQQLVRAANVQLVTTSGTKIVVNGGITFTGSSNLKSIADSIYIYKTAAVGTEGWLDSTATGVLDGSSTGNVLFRGSFRQSIYGKTRFYDMAIRNTAGDTLLSSIEVRNQLRLDTGFVFTESGYGNDSLWVSNPATTAISSTSNYSQSWVNGRLSRTGNVTSPYYHFPIGKTNILYADIRLLKSNTNTATWTAEYFDGLPFDYTNVFFPPIDHISRVEYWEINSNIAGADDNARVSLSWRGHSRVSANPIIRDSLLVVQYINRPPFKWDAPGGWVTGNAVGPDSLSGMVTSNTAASFPFPERRFTLGTFSKLNALPVKLVYFTAIADGNKVRLNWEVYNEQDTKLYEVERSFNAVDFSKLSTVNSLDQLRSAYTDHDFAPASGWNYYRLKIIDRSGSYFYSQVRPVRFEKGLEQVKIFPNPAADVLNIQLPSSYVNQTTLQVYSKDGKFISSIKPSANMVVLNVLPLSSGTYIIQLVKKDGSKESYRFVKQ